MSQMFMTNHHSGQWEPIPLEKNRAALILDAEGRCAILDADRSGARRRANPAGGARLLGIILALRAGSAANARRDHILLMPSRSPIEILVNSDDDFQATGFRVLAHMDELLIGARERIYYSTEVVPRVVPFPDDLALAEAHCPRCKRPFEPGTPAVLSRANVWYHQSEEYPCFVYGPCVIDGSPTSLDGGYLWSPAEFDRPVPSVRPPSAALAAGIL